jgi:hypothetical protein
VSTVLQDGSLESPDCRCHGSAGGRPSSRDERPNEGPCGGPNVDGRPNLEAHLVRGSDGNANLEAHLGSPDGNAHLEAHMEAHLVRGSDGNSHLEADLDRIRRAHRRPDLGQRWGRQRCQRRPDPRL